MNTLKSEQAKRIDWVDCAKGILIVLMVIGHNIQFGSGAEMLSENLYYDNWIFKIIYSFHMPCLMLISGFLSYYSIQKKSFVRKRIKNLVIPTVCWSIIRISLSICKDFLANNISISTFIYSFVSIFTTFWFCWAIIFCSFIIWFVAKYLKDSIYIYCFIWIVMLFIPDWLNTELWKFMYPYFIVGYYANKKNLSAQLDLKYVLISLAIGFAFLFYFYDKDSFVYTSGININSLNQLWIDMYRYIIGFVGSLLFLAIIYLICQNYNCRFWGGYLGKRTFLIYIIDCYINLVLPILTINLKLNYFVVCIEAFFVILICIVIQKIIVRIPVLKILLVGNR